MCRLSDIESNHNAGQQTSREEVSYLLAVIRAYGNLDRHIVAAEAACEEPEQEEPTELET